MYFNVDDIIIILIDFLIFKLQIKIDLLILKFHHNFK
jgi:hypothetical protein